MSGKPFDALTLARLEPIRGMSPGRLEELAAHCRPVVHPLGSDPFKAAPLGGELVYLLEGELKLTLIDGSMRLLVGGCDQANWPIGYHNAVPVASKAVTDVSLLRLDFDLIDLMMAWDDIASHAGADADASSEASLWRTMGGALSVQALVGGTLAKLPPAHLQELLRRFDRIKVRRGDVIIREGEAGDYYYVIEKGRCEVARQVGGAEVKLADLKAGDPFGEEALIAEKPRNASVRMKTDGVLLRLAKPDFDELLRTPLLHGVSRAEAEQLAQAPQTCWLDVRYAAEFAENGLPGAVNVPLNEIRSAYHVLDKQRRYIVYCQSGRRSSAAAFLLAQQGFDACWLEGGLANTENLK